jgi:hypothetical protein
MPPQPRHSANPAPPWLARPEWREGRIESSDTKAAWLFWIMAAAFLGVSAPAVLAIPTEWGKGNRAILVALLFPVAGIGLATAAARATLRRRKFGRSVLELHTLPGVIGGTLSGAIEIPAKVRTTTGFRLRLACIERKTSGSGKNRSTHERILWEEEIQIVKDFLDHERDRTGLPVFFQLPHDQPETLDGNPAILWRLEVSADVPGVDYAARFEVPVFRPSERQAPTTPVSDPTLPFQPPAEAWSPPAGSRIEVIEAAPGDTELRFPAARNAGVVVGLLGFTTLWTGLLWFMLVKEAPVIFPIVFGAFDLLLTAVVCQLLFHSVRVTANRSGIQVRHQFLLLSWTRTLRLAELQSITLKPGMQSGSRVFYDLKLETATGKTITAGSHIPDKKHAEWLVRRLQQAIGRNA